MPLLALAPNLALAADAEVQRPLMVGSELDYPPFALVRDGNVADGFTAELWRAVAKEAHLDSTITTGSFHDILQRFRDGQIDVLINLAQSDERRQFADFSVPHVKMSGAIFVRKGYAGIQAESDLSGKSLIVIKADLAHDYALKRGWTQLTLVNTVADGVELLAKSDSHDAMLVGRLVGLNTIRELDLGNLKPLDTKLEFQQDFAFAVHKGNADLLARINDGLANVRASGVYDAIYAKWFGGLEPEPLTFRRLLEYLIPPFILLLLLSLAFLRERRLRLRWKESASVLDATIESTTDGIIVLDSRGRLVHCNQRFLGFWSIPARLIDSRDGENMLHFVLDQLTDPAVFSAKARDLSANPMSDEFALLHFKEGRCFECFSKPQIVGSKPVGRVWSFRDVSERIQTQEALLAAELRYRTIFEQAGVGVAQVESSTGRPIRVNHRYCEITGLTEAEMLSRSFVEMTHPDDIIANLDQMEQLRRGEIDSFTTEKRYVRQDGSIVWVNLNVAPLWRPGEPPTYHIGVAEDITERKLAEAELARHREHLEALLAERTRRSEDLRLLTQELVVTEERERRRLAVEVHDQIGQTLALAQIKLGAIQHVSSEELAALIVEVRQMVDQSIRATRSLTTELGATVLRELGLEAALESLADETQKHHGIKCTFTDDGSNRPLSEEMGIALFRVARELIVNVIKHAHAQHADILLNRENGMIALTVTDNGVGFVVADEGFRSTKSGGFGLFSIQERLAQLGGTLRISSRPGAGTCVIIEAPVA